MRSQMPQRAANWAIQDGEILPSKLKREKAEIEQRTEILVTHIALKRQDNDEECRLRWNRDDAI
jgi:hypothetical protein